MTVASGAVPREVPLMPGGRRVLGHAVEFGRDPLALLQRAREHGDVVRIRFGPFHVFVLNSPDAIRQALVSQARKLEKGLSFGRAKRLIGNGLVMAEGESHRRQRRTAPGRTRRPAGQGAPGSRRYVDRRGDLSHRRCLSAGGSRGRREAHRRPIT